MIKNKINLSLIKNAGIYTISSALNSAIPFLLIPFLTRVFTTEEYGNISMFLLLWTFFTAIIGVQGNALLPRIYVEKDKDYGLYIGNSIIILIISILILSPVTYLCIDFLGEQTKLNTQFVYYAFIIGVCQYLIKIPLFDWQMKKKPMSYGLFRILQTCVDLGLSLFFILILLEGWESRLEAQLIAFVLFGLLSLYFIFSNNRVKFKIDIPTIRHLLNYGIPIIPHVIGVLILTMSDRYFISIYHDLEQVGIYSVGYQIAMVISLLQNSFNQAWSPYAYEQLKKDSKSIKLKIVKITYGYFLAILGITFLIGLIAPLIIPYFVGKGFEESGVIIFWICLAFSFLGMQKMVSTILYYAEKTKLVSISTGIAAVLNILLNILLIPKYGIYGAAYASCISFFISFIFSWYWSTKAISLPWKLKA